jgi:ligand-binding SRPBCC domain-containing protein
MKIYIYKAEQLLKTDEMQAWNFFSDPANLARITPPSLDFRIMKMPKTSGIHNGMQIEYSVKPLFGIPFKWKTEIHSVVPGERFTDTQLSGPYKLWEHTHIFKHTRDGILMTDVIRYSLPLGFLGEIAHTLFVKNRISEIFDYRRKVLEKLFSDHVGIDA